MKKPKTTLSPKQLSAMAITLIELDPEHWNQMFFHCAFPCGTCFCWAGYIDQILGAPQSELIKDCLYFDVREAVGLCDEDFEAITYPDNTLQDLKGWHAFFFDGARFAPNGMSREEYDEFGINYHLEECDDDSYDD